MPLHPAAADLHALHTGAARQEPGACQVEPRRMTRLSTSAGRQDQSGPRLPVPAACRATAAAGAAMGSRLAPAPRNTSQTRNVRVSDGVYVSEAVLQIVT
jgi:hypothetical protein